MQQLPYNDFYKRYGILKIQDLYSKRRGTIEEFIFAKNSLLLYPGEHLDENTPLNQDEIFFKTSSNRKIYVVYKFETDIILGSVRHAQPRLLKEVMMFHNSHPGFKKVNDTKDLTKVNETFLTVISFSLTDESYRYALNPLNAVYRKMNLLNTIVKEANNTKIDRDIYLPIMLESGLPTPNDFIRHARLLSKKTIEIFTTFSDIIMLELWKVIGKEESIFDKLDMETLSKFNLIFFNVKQWYVINLKTLLSFSSASDFKSSQTLEPMLLRKLVLRSLLKMIKEDHVDSEGEFIGDAEIDTKVIDEDLESLYEVNLEKETVIESNIDEELDEETFDPNEPFIGEYSIAEDTDYISKFESIIESEVGDSNLTAAEYRERKALVSNLATLKDPDSNQLLIEKAKVTPEQLVIKDKDITLPDSKVVPVKSMLKSTLISLDRDYVNNVMDRHTKGVVLSLLQAGIAIQSYETEKEESILGEYVIHRVSVKPLNGVSKKITFKLPVVNEYGEFKTGGNKYRLKRQRVDLPIRKISESRVALSSYYGKVFVHRSDYRANDLAYFIANDILTKGYNEIEPIISVVPGKTFNNKLVVPRIISMLALYLSSFRTKTLTIIVDEEELEKLGIVKLDGYKHAGFTNNKEPIMVNFDNEFFVLKDKTLSPIGDIYDIARIEKERAPMEYTMATVFSQSIPLGLILSYLIGFNNLIKLLKVTPKIIDSKERYKLTGDEYVLKFTDFKMILSKKDKEASLMLGGFNYFSDYLKQIPLASLNNKSVFLDILESKKITARYLREINNLDAMFVDPITKDVLIEMKEPTTFKLLLVRSNQLLLSDAFPDEQDVNYSRFRGYERFAGFVYRELVDSYRDYNARMIKGKNSLELNPNAVLMRITTDNTKALVADINPIENLKQQEGVTFSGDGGRSKDAISIGMRSYHESEIGIISEASVDSGDIGVNVSLSSNPGFKNLLGMVQPFNKENGLTSVLSTSGNVGVGTLNDHGRRSMFHSIQNSHTVGVKAYTQNYLRTGYDSIIGSRVSPTYCVNAELDGMVKEITDKSITVIYSDKTEKKHKLGTIIGSAEGSYYPHDLVTNLKVNSKFKAGDNICYNTSFFETDMLDDKKVIWKNALFVKTAFLEAPETYEDSSSISENLATKLTADTVKVRSIVLGFNEVIHKPLTVGTVVDVDTVLLLIEDEFTNRAGLFDDESIENLKKLSDRSPKAKYKGTVIDVVVYYNGELEFMSESLRKLSIDSNKRLKSNGSAYTGSVDSEYRVDGTSLAMDTLEIKFFIRVSNSMISGDKVVYGSQLKSIVNKAPSVVTTETGEVVDAIYGAQSLFNRIVINPYLSGSTTTLLKLIAKRAVEIYKK